MRVLTEKKFKEYLDSQYADGWTKGNNDSTKAWQNEFKMQTKEYKVKLNKLEKIVEKYVVETNKKMKKDEIYNKFELLCGDLLNEIDNLRG